MILGPPALGPEIPVQRPAAVEVRQAKENLPKANYCESLCNDWAAVKEV